MTNKTCLDGQRDEASVTVMLDSLGFSKKPAGKEVGLISNRISQFRRSITINELAKEITLPDAKTWMPSVISGNRRNENWESQQVVALDFDKDLKFQDAINRLVEYGLSCTFAYSTFNSSGNDKYRLVFVLGEKVTDRNLMGSIMENFRLLFPEADKAATDLVRMFYGGKEIIFENYKYALKLDLLEISAVTFQVSDCRNDKAIKRRFEKLSKNLIPNTIYNRNEKKGRFETIRNFDWEKARENCQILDDFMNGDWLYHQQLFGIATNLLWVEGGLKMMNRKMLEVGKYSNNNFNVLKAVRTYKYSPMRLENFSPCEEDHIYNNVLEAGRIVRGEVVRKKDFDGEPWVVIYDKIQTKMLDFFRESSNNIHIISAPTGTGKTTAYLKMDTEENATYAFPNHDLKMDVAGDFVKNGKSILVTPSAPNFSSTLQNKLDYFYKVGASKEAHNYIVSTANNSNSTFSNDDDSFLANQYLNDFEEIKKSNSVILTTHQSAFSIQNNSTIVFDEDPIRNSILKTGELLVSDMLNLKNDIKSQTDFKLIDDLIVEIIRTPKNKVCKYPDIVFENYDAIVSAIIKANSYKSAVLDFLNSDYYTVDPLDSNRVLFIRYKPFPTNKKILILSATANEWIYSKLFPERLKFHSLGNAKLMGKLVQDTTYSFSRQNLGDKGRDILGYSTKAVEDRMVITFAQYASKFNNARKDIYFGKLEGFNRLNGQKLAVVGTPHVHPSTYYMYSKVLGLDLKPEDFVQKMLRVENDGMEFNFYTYENQALRNIQFYFIESELRQAIGRARLVREIDADVLILSNYPLREAMQKYEY